MTLAAGTTLGRYEIRAQLGAGGMGEVYLAEDTQLGRRVAIKLLPPETISDEHARKRLVREARAAATLDHPNICSVYEVGEADGRSFIAMQYVEGETLDFKLKRKSLELKESLTIASQVADALSEAHAHGTVHRDIKPGNIMITSRGQAKVMDFGVAKVIHLSNTVQSEAETEALLSTPGAIIGTVPYMSPEQVQGNTLDGRSDIFSFGVVLYEMLGGRQPFASESSAATAAAILTHEPPPLARYSKEVPAELERIVSKALRKDPDERYQTAKDLLIDLRQLKKRLEFAAELERTESPDRRADAPTKTSIAVLPFANMSNDAENEYFCDGLAEELLNALAKIENLKVAARTSAFSFKGKNANIGEIGRALNVNSVLEGSVRKSGNQVRITVQLVNAADGYHLWSERYDREMRDIFDVQDEITLSVIDALKLKLLGEEKAVVLKRYTDNTEAYELYLKGRYQYNKYMPENWQKAIEYFEKATEKEPEYAPAYAGIGFCHGALWYFGFLPSHEIVPQWRAVTNRALEIDDALADAHLSLASIHFYYEWNFVEAERDYQRAIELNPNSPDAHWRYGSFLASRERFDQAIDEGQRALALDPLSVAVNFFMVRIYWLAGRLDEALEQARKMIEMEPNFPGAHLMVGAVYATKGMHEEAIEEMQKSLALGGDQIALSYLGCAYGLAGKRDEALGVLSQLLEMRGRRYVPGYSMARVFGGLGENDKAFEWLDQAVAGRSGELVFLKREMEAGIFSKSIGQDPRFQDILRRVGFPVDESAQGKATNEASGSEPPAVAGGPNLLAHRSQVKTGPPATAGGSDPNTDREQTLRDKPKMNRTLLVSILLGSLLLAAIGLGYWFFAHRPANRTPIESIAVLPFVNESGNADNEYLSDGMTESLINSLSQLPNLNVKARSLVFRYKGKDTDARTIGKELNVQALLNGRVVQHRDGLTLYLELVDTQTGNQIWGDQYNRKQTDLVSLQSEIAVDVSQKLKTKLSGADEQKLTKKYTENAEAYQLYLKGRFFVNRRTSESLQKAIEYFNQAISIDPNYALGYAGLADSYLLLGIPDAITGALSPQDSLPKARAAAEKALQIDNSVGEIYASLAHVKWKERDWAGAEKDFDRSIRLNPNYPIGHLYHAVYLSSLDRQDEAVKEISRAQELDPLSLPINASVAYVLYFGRQYDEAIAAGKKTLEMDAAFPLTHQRLGLAYVQKKMYREAILSFQQAANNSNRAPLSITSLGHAYAVSGNKVEAQKVLAELKELSQRRYVSPYSVALIYVGLGEKEQAFQWLEKANDERNTELVFLRVDPRLDPLRDDPRFADLVRRVGLPK